MRMSGTMGWMMMMVLLGNGLLPLTTAHVCDSRAGSYVCDPAHNGSKYFLCGQPGGIHFSFGCPAGLVFNEQKSVCDWPRNTPPCRHPLPPLPQPTTTTTTTTPSPTNPPNTTAAATTRDVPVTSGHSPATTGHSPVNTTTTAPVTTTSTAPVTTAKTAAKTTNPCAAAAAEGKKFVCDPATNGTTFLVCVGEGEGEYHRQSCPPGTFFNPEAEYCDWRENIRDMCVAAGSASPGGPSSTAGPAPSSTSPAGATTTTTTTTRKPPTGPCNSSSCQLPECRCEGIDIPGNLTADEVPQMVLLTFDDGVNPSNWPYYQQLFGQGQGEGEGRGRRNDSRPCGTPATFFVSDDYTDMSLVKTLWSRGHEIASHSRTHTSPAWWDGAKWTEEMQGMREKLATALGVPLSEVSGMRTPFLQLGGEVQFSMMQTNGFTYDTSMFGGSLHPTPTPVPVWPFSLHYPPSPGVCDQGHCPKASYPGVWEVPLIRQYDLSGNPCSMTDACVLPTGATPSDVSRFLSQNFERHYLSNRAPFMISLHATWFSRVPATLQGLQDFLREVRGDPQVFTVTVTQMLDWVRHPLPRDRLHELPSWKSCV